MYEKSFNVPVMKD